MTVILPGEKGEPRQPFHGEATLRLVSLERAIGYGRPLLLYYSYSVMPEAERYQQYEVLRRGDGSLWELGRGAMGITYKAFDTNLRCTVALKVINSTYLGNDTARQRFLREARAAAALRHPNVASVFNLGTDQDSYFYVMEFIDGETVEACVKRKGRLEPAEALNLTLQVTRALAAAAKERLVHRDLKPSNLMLVEQDGESVVKVIDFGLAKSAKDAGEDTAALTVGGFVGTPHFASPEQVEEGDLDIRSDIYSLGATLYFMVTGKAPFSGSVGQVMSQHLYRPINIEPLTIVPQCVVSLIQSMLAKDRNQRPQTPRDLQNAIVACLEEIRGHSTRVAREAAEEPLLPLSPEVLLARNYRLIEELRESPQGRHFLAEDVQQKRLVCLLILRQELVSDPDWFMSLQIAVERLRNAPHPMLRAIYTLEKASGYTILAEEHVVGPSLLDLLRSRSVLKAPEVVRLLSLLAPLADHASAKQLEHVELTLLGIHFVIRESTASEIQPDLLRRPLTTWEQVEPKVNAIDFSFALSQAGTLTGMETRIQDAAAGGPRDSCVRSLSLLAYELLGGPRARVEATGRYNPIAALTRDGNAVLRRGLIDEFPSAGKLAAQLAIAVGSAPVLPDPQEVAALSIQSDPPGASILLDGKPPQRPPNTFTHVLFGAHQLTATLDDYEPIKQELQVSRGMTPEIRLKLRQIQELAALSIHSDPPGASILLDGKPPPRPPNTFTHVAFGTHQLTATLDDYEPIKQDLQVSRGMTPEVRLKLRQIQEVAALSIHSDPPGASILLDGKAPQRPPNTFTHVAFGTHQLTATLDDYEPIKQELWVSRGMTPEIRLKLRQIQEVAALSIQSDPPGASILLDGKPPQRPPNTFTHVSFGTHQLTATLDDYEPIKQALQVSRGISPEIRLKLRQIQEVAALSIQSDPLGASILLDGKPPERPPNTFTHVPFGTHQLTATLDDYEPIKQELQVSRGMTPEIRLKLRQIQEVAALSIQSDPPGASILLDGKPPQRPPNTFTHVPFGTHQLTATLDDYEPIKQDLQVSRGMTPEIRLKLRQIQEVAVLSIHSDPPGASILLDGKPPQRPPNTFTHVPFGTHQLTGTLEDYEPIKQELQVSRGMTPEIRLKLRQIQELAALSIQSDPPGASILLNGKPPQRPPNTFTHVSFGTHQLTATLDDYEPIKQELQVGRGMTPEIRLKLRQIQEVAVLSIQSDPPGASILLDGKPPQRPPNRFTDVRFGKHQLTATLDNYEPIRQDIQVRRGVTPEIHLKLKPSRKPSSPVSVLRLVVAIGVLASLGIGSYLIYLKFNETASLSVQSDPASASILLDGKPPQEPANTFTHVPFGKHQLTATLDDYEPIKQDLEVRKGMTPKIGLKLRPIQEIASLSVQTDPPGAAILLDGKSPQGPANSFTHVPFGTHQLIATLDNYEPIKQDLEVRKGMAPKIALKLRPIQEIAALSVQSDPADAAILLDGKPPQGPANTFTHVPFGTHQLTATLDNYEPVKQEIEVRKGMTPKIPLKLTPVQEVAALSVQSDPAGASILLDGKSPQGPANTFTHVPFGTHQLTATLDNYEPVKQDIEVRKGMTPKIPLKLTPIQEIASLSVQSDPPGASIFLDGKPPQGPSNTFTHVPFGRHQLTAALDNYESIKKDIEVGRGMAPEIRLKLDKKADPVAELMAQTKKYDEGSPQYLTAYVRLVQFVTTSGAANSGEYVKELVRIIERLRTKMPSISKDEFNLSYKGSVRDAANLNLLPAILWLADNEKESEAFNLFLRAANQGDSYAMMKVGRSYLKKGTTNDDVEGFRWLNRAYNAPDRNLEAGAFIGDCYLSGKGTKQDLQKAEEIIVPLANQNVVPAMTLAGRILQYKADVKRAEAGSRMTPLKQKQLNAEADELDTQARKWWERAAEKEDWNAWARLGQCYAEGWGGVEKNEGEAEKRYKEGINHGNALSMFFYGLLIEKKPDRRAEAETLISKAAAMGLSSARKWCKENKVNFTEAKSGDERP